MSAHESSLRVWKAQKALQGGRADPLGVMTVLMGAARATTLLEETCTRPLGHDVLKVRRDPRSHPVRAALLAIVCAIGLQSQGRSGTGLLRKITGYSRRHVQRQLAMAEGAGLKRYQPPAHSGAPSGPSGYCYGQWSWAGVIHRPHHARPDGVPPARVPPASAPAPAAECADVEYRRQRAHVESADDASAADDALAWLQLLKRRPH